MKRLFPSLAAFLLIGSSTAILAQEGGEENMPELADLRPAVGRLQLNDQQQKQMEQMRIDMEKQLIGVRSKAQMARLELRQLLNADNPDKAAIEKKIQEIAQIRGQGASIRLNHWFDVNKILTPDQQKVWRERLKHPFAGRMHGMRGHDGWGGQWNERMLMREGRGRFGEGPEIRREIRREIRENRAPEKK
jgi:Spy/CpxP family protein refolding chaperone